MRGKRKRGLPRVASTRGRQRMEMDDGAKGWLIKTARQNFWRVSSWYDLEDLIQEGFECWAYVLQRYPTAVDRPHVMRLFQLTYRSRIEDIAKKRTRDRELIAELPYRCSELDDEIATLATLISQAPDIVKAFLLILSSERGRRRLRSEYRVERDGTRETFNERLRRLTNCPKNVDLVSVLQQYFSTR